MSRAIWLVLDSLGIGAAPDAADYGDAGADTFGHIAGACVARRGRPLGLPNLTRLGLPQAHAAAVGAFAAGFERAPSPIASFGFMVERSAGKDTPSGHWESAGVVVQQAFGRFEAAEESFPPGLLAALADAAGLPGLLGNCHASGTEILVRLGAEHLASGKPIVYTSADSVFQIAAHEQAFGLDRLYRVCSIARELLAPWNIARVIARPFVGDPTRGFRRTGNRHDYSLPPPAPTLFDVLTAAGGTVVGVGKIGDIFAHRGVEREVLASGHDALMDATLAELARAPTNSLIATNFVDFDSVYGHRRDVLGYAGALEAFDASLPRLLDALRPDDLLVLSADHGCDPTWSGTDHTRECVPLMAFAAGQVPRALGRRDSFADLGQGIAHHLGLPPLATGRSFLDRGSASP